MDIKYTFHRLTRKFNLLKTELKSWNRYLKETKRRQRRNIISTAMSSQDHITTTTASGSHNKTRNTYTQRLLANLPVFHSTISLTLVSFFFKWRLRLQVFAFPLIFRNNRKHLKPRLPLIAMARLNKLILP